MLLDILIAKSLGAHSSRKEGTNFTDKYRHFRQRPGEMGLS